MTRPPRASLAFLIAALASALAGQSFLTGVPLRLAAGVGGVSGFRLGVVCLGAAVLFAMFAAARPSALGARDTSRSRPARRAASGAGILCGVLAAALYAVSGESVAVHVLWVAGVLLFLLAFWNDSGALEVSAEGGGRLWDAALVFALSAIGFALRYVRLTDWPADLDADFASAGLGVAALTGDPRFIGVGDSNLPLVFYRLLQGSTALFGLNLHGLMIQSALFGTLLIGAVYFLGREVGGRAVGLLAAALLATGYTAIHFSRVILTPTAVLAVTVMVALLLRGLRTGGRRWFALAGLAGGAACLLYFAGRVAPVVAAAILVGDLARRSGNVRRRLVNWAVMAGAALLALGPMLVFYVRTPRTLVARGADVTVFAPANQAHLMGKYGVHTVPEMLLEQTRRTFLTFHLFGDSSSEFGYRGPLVDVPTAAFLLLGLGLILRRWRRPEGIALLAWVMGVLVVGGVLTLDPPDWVHLVAALPAIVVLSALGMQRLVELWRESLGRVASLVISGVLVAVLVATALVNWHRYRLVVEDNAGPYCSLARFIDGLPAGTRVLLVADPLSFSDRTLLFFSRGVEGVDVKEDDIRGLTAVEKPTAVILTPNHSESLFPLLLQRFPSAEALTRVSHGSLVFYCVRIVPPGTEPAPPYDTFGKTSALGWGAGFLVVSLASLIPLMWPRRETRRETPEPREAPETSEETVAGADSAAAARDSRAAEGEDRPAREQPAGTMTSLAEIASHAEPSVARRPWLLLAGLVLAYLAQAVFDANRPEGIPFVWRFLFQTTEPFRVGLATALLGLAGALWWLAIGPLTKPPAAARKSQGLRTASGTAALFALPIALGTFAVVRFIRLAEDPWVRSAWAASLLALIIVLWVDQRRRPTPRAERESSPRFKLVHVLILLAILAAAGWLRFYRLGFLPDDFHGDMASYGLTAREYLLAGETRIFGVAWAEIPRIGYQPTVLAMRVFGNDVRGLMATAAVGGILFLVALYALTWRLFDSHRLALLATGVAAGNAAHIHFSRIAAYMDPWPFGLGALFFFIDGLRGRRPLSMAVSGILLGFGVQMYFSGRMVVFLLAAVLLHCALFRREWLRGAVFSLAAFVTGFVLTLGPNIPFFLKAAHALNSRGRQVWLFSPDVMAHLSGVYHTRSPLQILFIQAERTLLTFNHTIDTSTQFGYRHAMLSPLVSPLFVLGLVLALRRLRGSGPALMVSFWGLMLLLGGILTVDAPFWPRLVGVVAPAAVFAALALETLAATAASLRPGVVRLMPVVFAAFLAAVAAREWRTYVADYRANGRSSSMIGRYLASLPGDVTSCGVKDPFWLKIREIEFLAWPRPLVDLRADQAAAMPPPCDARPLVWVLSWNHAEFFDELKGRWPQGAAESHSTPEGYPVFLSFFVPREGAGTAPR